MITEETKEAPPSKTSASASKMAAPRVKTYVPFFHRPVVVYGGVMIAIVLIVFIASVVLRAMTHESTDDAFIDAHIVSVAPKVAGKVLSVKVTDNQFVKKGDLLVEIDPADFQSVVNQRQAALDVAIAKQKSADASLKQAETHMKTIAAAMEIAKASASATQASTQLSHSDLERSKALVKTGVVSAQDFEHTKSAVDTADANLESKIKQVDAAAAYVDEAVAQKESTAAQAVAAKADVDQAKAVLDQAILQLSYTRITAPQDGRVTNKSVEPGDYVQTGQALLAMVSPDVWVTANFKETQITDMRPGQPVEVEVDAYPGRALRAHVDSVQAGSGSRFSLLPPENATGNFVKVVQRVPVKIVFDEQLDVQRILGPGMSVVPVVRVREGAFALIIVVIVAVVAAAGVVFAARFWLRKIHAPQG